MLKVNSAFRFSPTLIVNSSKYQYRFSSLYFDALRRSSKRPTLPCFGTKSDVLLTVISYESVTSREDISVHPIFSSRYSELQLTNSLHFIGFVL